MFRANNAINTDGRLARAFGAHSLAAGYGGRQVQMRTAAAFLALMLAALPALGASKLDLETDFLRSGFVRGVQNHTCRGPLYVAELASGELKVRPATAKIVRFGFNKTLGFSGKSVRYEARNEGEFGGKLEAVLKSGERRLMLNGNTQSLVPVGKDLYAFEGLSHLSMATGSIYVIRSYDQDPKVQRDPVTFLPDTPVYAALRTKDHGLGWFWVVGTHSLVAVITDWHMLQVHSWDEFSVGEVSSFAEDDRGVLIGTCGGVIAIEVPCRRAPRSANDKPCAARFYVPKTT